MRKIFGARAACAPAPLHTGTWKTLRSHITVFSVCIAVTFKYVFMFAHFFNLYPYI